MITHRNAVLDLFNFKKQISGYYMNQRMTTPHQNRDVEQPPAEATVNLKRSSSQPWDDNGINVMEVDDTVVSIEGDGINRSDTAPSPVAKKKKQAQQSSASLVASTPATIYNASTAGTATTTTAANDDNRFVEDVGQSPTGATASSKGPGTYYLHVAENGLRSRKFEVEVTDGESIYSIKKKIKEEKRSPMLSAMLTN